MYWVCTIPAPGVRDRGRGGGCTDTLLSHNSHSLSPWPLCPQPRQRLPQKHCQLLRINIREEKHLQWDKPQGYARHWEHRDQEDRTPAPKDRQGETQYKQVRALKWYGREERTVCREQQKHKAASLTRLGVWVGNMGGRHQKRLHRGILFHCGLVT